LKHQAEQLDRPAPETRRDTAAFHASLGSLRHYGERRTPVLANVDDRPRPSNDLLIQRGWAKRKVAEEQLHDLTFDPNEARNMADDPVTVV